MHKEFERNSKDSSDSRKWRKDRDVANVWSSQRYELEIRTYEENRRNFDKMRVFRFQLEGDSGSSDTMRTSQSKLGSPGKRRPAPGVTVS